MSGSFIQALARHFGNSFTPIARREFVRQILAAGVASSLLGNHGQGAAEAKKKVVIVGAGLSGLCCGFELLQAGHEVTVVEAKRRLGGRVFSSNDTNRTEFVSGKNIEYGAELIGSNHPLWMHYAVRFQLDLLDVTEDPDAELAVHLQGKKLTPVAAEKLWDGLDEAFQSFNELARTIDADHPWNSPRADELDRQSVADFLDTLPVDALVKHALNINLMADNGQTTQRQSLLGFLTQVSGGGVERYWTESEVYRCQGGNDQLATALADGIGRDRIRLGINVTDIMIDDSGVLVTLSNTEQVRADQLVLSVAPSAWNRIRFQPALPNWLKPQMGLNTKYFAVVKNRYWLKRESPLSQYCLSDGRIQLTWEGTDNQQPDQLDRDAVLVGFSGGPGCQQTSALSEKDRDAAFKLEFERLLPGFEQNFSRSTYMDWPSEPWTRASYSFPAPGEVTKLGPSLAEAHFAGRLFIAGEHSCYKFVGYMEGALQSGQRVARQISQS